MNVTISCHAIQSESGAAIDHYRIAEFQVMGEDLLEFKNWLESKSSYLRPRNVLYESNARHVQDSLGHHYEVRGQSVLTFRCLVMSDVGADLMRKPLMDFEDFQETLRVSQNKSDYVGGITFKSFLQKVRGRGR
jgi:hypothetical protein